MKEIEPIEEKYRANFLFPHNDESIEEAGYEFCNAISEDSRKLWWDILLYRIRRDANEYKCGISETTIEETKLWLSSREVDIALGIEDFGELQPLFFELFGVHAKDVI